MNMNHVCDIPSFSFIYSKAPCSKVGPNPITFTAEKQWQARGSRKPLLHTADKGPFASHPPKGLESFWLRISL